MKQSWIKISLFAVAFALLAPVSLLAQKEEKDKESKENKDTKIKKEVQQIIVTRKGDKDEKVVIEINGDKITVNGKPLDEYKDKEGNINVRVNNLRDYQSLYMPRVPTTGKGIWNVDGDNAFNYFNEDSNRAMLGVTTEKADDGVSVQELTKESAAAKAGLQLKDIITRIDDKKIESPDDLSAAIQKHKPGDKVTITYLRDKKEQKATAELTKWKGFSYFSMTPGKGFNMDLMSPKGRTSPDARVPLMQNWVWSGSNPKLGLSVQDTDDGKGVKVVGVDDESNAAKAGIKEDDIITEVNGKAVNGTDDMVKMIRENKDKASIMVKLQRGGKTQNIEVKMPHKIKTADL